MVTVLFIDEAFVYVYDLTASSTRCGYAAIIKVLMLNFDCERVELLV